MSKEYQYIYRVHKPMSFSSNNLTKPTVMTRLNSVLELVDRYPDAKVEVYKLDRTLTIENLKKFTNREAKLDAIISGNVTSIFPRKHHSNIIKFLSENAKTINTKSRNYSRERGKWGSPYIRKGFENSLVCEKDLINLVKRLRPHILSTADNKEIFKDLIKLIGVKRYTKSNKNYHLFEEVMLELKDEN